MSVVWWLKCVMIGECQSLTWHKQNIPVLIIIIRIKNFCIVYIISDNIL